MTEAAVGGGNYAPTIPALLGLLIGSRVTLNSKEVSKMWFHRRDIVRLLCACFDTTLYGAILAQFDRDIGGLAKQVAELGVSYGLSVLVDAQELFSYASSFAQRGDSAASGASGSGAAAADPTQGTSLPIPRPAYGKGVTKVIGLV